MYITLSGCMSFPAFAGMTGTLRVGSLSDGHSATWGFFPELAPVPSDYPACIALQKHFDTQLLQLSMLKDFPLQLAFIRLATSEPQSAFGGLHIDASAGIDHLPPKDTATKDRHILRILINLHDKPRELQYCAQSIQSLRDRGMVIPEDHYEIIKLPPDIRPKSYFVPPHQTNLLHGVMFDSSSVLHAGRTNQHGHFLLSYGGYADKETLRNQLLVNL